ncbi:MAG TPA: Asp-tRNA(Asn)/Glu-tRNA(Gln) amidotransferase subunit GatB [Actinomycetota bacterium]|jgi:aspartyl-tRNA(Asn)/glutamyl-tRNA(Gln) amidotransferase subunit B|nr:Asp-tRNA(Asn)/Glu-tRNA(Gln) amidotransferase subunit GatB [Actinomycetota bacterium]
MTEVEAVIGLECHVELNTQTKMFCGCRAEFGAAPNTNVCPVCLGHPGSLPVPNREAIRRIILIGLAVGSEIAPHSLFHRKNYFYPDMPKNYQISQYDLPICVGGHLDVDLPDGTTSRIGITRVHMEEDTGKTVHASATGRIHDADAALIDFNRAGVPLVECVSEPDIRSPEEAAAYLRELRATLESLDVSDVRMEEGSLRCDANISMRPVGTEAFGTKVEIKNMNSIRSLERALHFEIERQTKALEAGEAIAQETRHWDEDSGSTKSMRSKEEAFDYRYFPEPDIPALEPSEEWIAEIRAGLPELPRARRARYETDDGLKSEVARVLVGDRASSALFDETVALGADPKAAANWITQDLAGSLNKLGVDPAGSPVTAQHISDLIALVADDTVSGAGAKQALEEAVATGDPIAEIVERKGLTQVSDSGALGAIAEEVLAENPEVVEQFRGGKEAVIGFLVGQVMKKSAGSANPKLAKELLLERLSG